MDISLNSNVTCQEDKGGCVLHPERVKSLLKAKYGSTFIRLYYIVSKLAWVIVILHNVFRHSLVFFWKSLLYC